MAKLLMWDASIDYLRMTSVKGKGYEVWHPGIYHQGVLRAGRYVDVSGSNILGGWAFMGYSGVRLGAASWGAGDQGCIIQGSGLEGAEIAALGLPFTNIPRIDLQITAWYSEDQESLAEELAEAASGRKLAWGGKAKQRLIRGFGAGDTLYSGNREGKSAFIRIYDKWRQSGQHEYKYAWRYEIELKNEEATEVYQSLLRSGITKEAIAGRVRGYLDKRGYSCPEFGGIKLIEPHKLPKRKSDSERKLEWLRAQVRPSIRELMEMGIGPVEIGEALGIDPALLLRNTSRDAD